MYLNAVQQYGLFLKYIEKVATVGGRTAGRNLHDGSTSDKLATTYKI